jgi:outer membrane protein assembly factor BamB
MLNISSTKKTIFLISLLLIGITFIPEISGNLQNEIKLNQDNVNQRGILSNIDWWPMFHHDQNHSGYTTSNGPVTNSTLWTFTADDPLLSSPIVANGKVFIGSNSGRMYCLNAITGEKIWDYKTGSSTGSAAISNGNIYFGSYDDYVHCLNADLGTKIWEFETGDNILSSPVVFNNRVYIGSFDGRLYCLDASNGEKIWEYLTGDIVVSSPAIYANNVCFGSADGVVYCLNAENGSVTWTYTTSSYIESSPAVNAGKIYIGSTDNNLYCLNADTGEKIWNKNLGDYVKSSPAFFDERIFVGSGDDRVYCLNETTGEIIWNYPTGDFVFSSPAVNNDYVYVGSDDDNLYCLDNSNGLLIWSYTAGHDVWSSPALVENKLYVGGRDGILYCFGEEGGNQPPTANFNWTPTVPYLNQTITLDASESYDPDGEIVLYEWDWDNDYVYEETHSTPIATHEWTNSGYYPISLRVTDNNGLTSGFTKTIEFNGISSVEDIYGGFGVCAIIRNIGNAPLKNLDWYIDFSGFVIYGSHTTGVIDALNPDETVMVYQEFPIGLGGTSIFVAAGESSNYVIALIIGPFVLVVQN